MKNVEIKLSQDQIEWAIRHLHRFGDTDILPVPEEYTALFTDAHAVSKQLSAMCLNKHEFKVPRRVAVPKAAGGFRIASQLNPIDAVLYTAFAGEIAPIVEAARIPKEEMKSCSFRASLSPDGQFFVPGFGFDDFNRATERFISDRNIGSVLSVDIADYYNQISHHRIANNLQAAGVSDEKWKIAESMLDSFASNHHSRGLPIGPAASIIFAEAASLDIDNFLIDKDVKWCRYVDDFRFFFSDENSAYIFLADFSKMLFGNHRLATNTEKTMLWSKSEFGGQVYNEEALEEEYRQIELMNAVRSRSSSDEPSNSGAASGAEKNQATRRAIDELFSRVESSEPIQVGLAKFVLRRASVLRTTKFIARLLDNLDHFLPVVGDVVDFTRAVDSSGSKGLLKGVFDWLTDDSKMSSTPFLQEWSANLLARHPLDLLNSWSNVEEEYERIPQDISNRYISLAAARAGNWGCVRSMKENIDSCDDAAKRATILSACILPKDEKDHWLNRFSNSPDVVIKACAQYARANRKI